MDRFSVEKKLLEMHVANARHRWDSDWTLSWMRRLELVDVIFISKLAVPHTSPHNAGIAVADDGFLRNAGTLERLALLKELGDLVATTVVDEDLAAWKWTTGKVEPGVEGGCQVGDVLSRGEGWPSKCNRDGDCPGQFTTVPGVGGDGAGEDRR
ncbi:uncharacterized protein CLUP02_14406 [Colletotrichum lupini]|uniref:Uncharacterized protein n=1 Tax=Colletotrichum lupini TaxID=145971 RepID=A0A9Q8T448_9PEZI|nr:uncharacterized protein CLUP02_14406 [Colletotrichum lupini]UQC88879.1 hypothetical protein CLUP02_14406 [Colletotrichum lupini]